MTVQYFHLLKYILKQYFSNLSKQKVLSAEKDGQLNWIKPRITVFVIL